MDRANGFLPWVRVRPPLSSIERVALFILSGGCMNISERLDLIEEKLGIKQPEPVFGLCWG